VDREPGGPGGGRPGPEDRRPLPEAPRTRPEAPPLPGTVAVLGLGLMGGSLARALAGKGPVVLGIDPDPIRGARLREEGTITRYGSPGDGTVAEADLVVLACPLGAACRFLSEEAPLLRPGAILTDLVSLNAPILQAADAAGIAPRMVTGHPMCGGEGGGLDRARATLFEGARVWLSALRPAGDEVRSRVEAFWAGVGARPAWIDAAEHDRRMAWVSHLPQLVASALAGALDAAGHRPEDLGPGGRDMVRLAGSSPAMWRELLEHSAPVAGAGLTSVARGLNAVADLLARRDLDRIAEFMELTRAWVHGEDALADHPAPAGEAPTIGQAPSAEEDPSSEEPPSAGRPGRSRSADGRKEE
jgi:prephenate dehydrogenase